jgi:hypothetical protein
MVRVKVKFFNNQSSPKLKFVYESGKVLFSPPTERLRGTTLLVCMLRWVGSKVFSHP